MNITKPLTKARLGALTVLNGGPARYSNDTVITPDSRCIYWQSADWLIEHGYAERATGNTVAITAAGTERLRVERQGA